MALQNVNTNTELAVISTDLPNRKKVINVLDEEAHSKNVADIIERDFFPDMPDLKVQKEYFDAVEKNDLVKLRQIQMGVKRTGSTQLNVYSSTPSTFETPDTSSTSATKPDKPEDHSPNPHVIGEKKLHTLDKYLSKNTSEDNASFTEIIEDMKAKHKEKHAWLYENEESRKRDEEDRLCLPSIEIQAGNTDSSQVQVNSWKYTARNSLMYVPDGEDLSSKELVEKQKSKAREIIHENTRFKTCPWNTQKNHEQIKQQASLRAFNSQGKIGHDGKEVTVNQSPNVNGYNFLATPSPAPGVDESPLMTWGEIENTPFRLDGSDTPSTGGTSFKIPEVPKRDQIAMELSEKASKAHRDKKEKALKSVQAATKLLSPAVKFGMSTTERLNSMSPAAQKLATSQLGVRKQTDKALRASYSPSPSHTPSRDKTPILLTPKSQRSSGIKTPGSKREGTDTLSLTDNLLQLPKRKKASDFF